LEDRTVPMKQTERDELARVYRALAEAAEEGRIKAVCGVVVMTDGSVTMRAFGDLNKEHILEEARSIVSARATPQ
jgi:thiamine monophosphate kinase